MAPRVTLERNGPTSPQEALSWIKQAIREGNFKRAKHLFDRIKDRALTVDDVLFAIQHAHRVEPYTEPPRHGGSTWRVWGPDRRGRRLKVGVEAYRTEEGRWAILCTVMKDERR